MSTSKPQEPVKLAILDDYANIAPQYFKSLVDAGRIELHSFPETCNTKTDDGLKLQISRLQPFMIISSMRERSAFPSSLLSELPNLKLLMTTGMRNASIDVSCCESHGIVVAGTTHGNEKMGKPKGYDATTEHTWALILGLAKDLARDDAHVKAGGWQQGLSFGLAGKTLGILGLGRLGLQTARIGAMAFGMEVLAWSSSLTQETADEKTRGLVGLEGKVKVAKSKEELFEKADVLSVHYVLSERSRGIVGAEELAAMKRNSLLVNTSRGPLVDESALLKTLKEGKIRGAALDVFDIEPLPRDSEWRTIPWGKEGRSELLLSPHMGYVEEQTMNWWYEETAMNVENWLNGKEVTTRFKSI